MIFPLLGYPAGTQRLLLLLTIGKSIMVSLSIYLQISYLKKINGVPLSRLRYY